MASPYAHPSMRGGRLMRGTPATPMVSPGRGVPRARAAPVPSVSGAQIGPSGGRVIYSKAIQGLVEITTGPIWHQVQVPAAATTTTAYFNVARGANRSVTNMTQASQLPGAIAYNVRKIGFGYNPDIDSADVQLLWNGTLVLSVGAKEVFEARVASLPYGGGSAGFSATTVAATTIAGSTNGVAAYSAMAVLAESYLIKGGQNFGATIFWAAGITVGTASETVVVMWGEFYRPM